MNNLVYNVRIKNVIDHWLSKLFKLFYIYFFIWILIIEYSYTKDYISE